MVQPTCMSSCHVRFLSGSEGVVDLSQCGPFGDTMYDKISNVTLRLAPPTCLCLALPCFFFFSCVAGTFYFFFLPVACLSLPARCLSVCFCCFFALPCHFLSLPCCLLPALLLTVHRFHLVLSYCSLYIVFAILAVIMAFLALPAHNLHHSCLPYLSPSLQSPCPTDLCVYDCLCYDLISVFILRPVLMP